MPPLHPQHHLEASNVGAMEAEHLALKVLRLAVEDGNATALWGQCVGRDNPLPL